MKSINIETQIRSLTRILEDLRNGFLQIPPFQRDFVWSRDDVKDLFDSIRNNYPIGSILIWKPLPDYTWGNKTKSIGSYTLPVTTIQRSYVLDGYQRLSALFGCLMNPLKSGLKYDPDVRKEFFDLYYDLSDQSFIYLGNRIAKPYQIPVYIMMSTSEFRQYSRKNMEGHVDEKNLDIYLNRADEFTRMLVDYKLAVIEVNDAELKDAVDIFSRVNSKGTDISYDWMVNALSYDDDNKFSFSNEIDNLLLSLQKYHFDGLSRNSLFRCYQSAFDEKSYIDNTEIEKMAQRDDFAEVVKETTPAIEKTVEFLFKELCVVDVKLLPYPTQLIFLMRVFMKYPVLDEKQKDELKRWFWITTYSNYFTIYNLSSQRRAFDQLMKYLKGQSNTMLYNESQAPFKVSPLPTKIQLSAVRSKALYLFELNYYAKSPTHHSS